MKSAVMMICWQEFTLNRRNRWVVSFALLFATLTVLLAYFGMVTSGYSGFQDFTRTSASIINLGGFLIPLFALLLGVFSFITNQGYFEILVTQPISRSKVLLGRYLGLLVTILAASLLGFGLPGALIALVIGVVGAQSYLLVIVYSMMLAMVFTGLSVLISLLARRRQIALGMALGVWVFYELFASFRCSRLADRICTARLEPRWSNLPGRPAWQRCMVYSACWSGSWRRSSSR